MNYITLTNHCTKRIISRKRRINNENRAFHWARYKFDLCIEGIESGKIKPLFQGNGKYSIAIGDHKFVYEKLGKIEYVLITYINRAKPKLLSEKDLT